MELIDLEVLRDLREDPEDFDVLIVERERVGTGEASDTVDELMGDVGAEDPTDVIILLWSSALRAAADFFERQPDVLGEDPFLKESTKSTVRCGDERFSG